MFRTIFFFLLVHLPNSMGVACCLAHAEEIDFNRQIRPILSENCFYCHGQDANKRQADLRLDLRGAAIEMGAIEPGSIESSSLVDRITGEEPDVQMPPPGSNRHLTNQQKELLKSWIAQGANYQEHWAFVAPERPGEPHVENPNWPRGAIDRFVLAKLDEAGLSPSPEAERNTLIKRLYADLLGLPPTPHEIDRFVNDSDPQAYEKLVDRLLEDEHYGERMSLSWLDAARYADSNGFQQDGDTWQWIWRDWVVRALNADLPFDQFTIWQLAGDLLPKATHDQKIASAFNRNHLLNGEGGAIAEEQRFNNLFDRIDTTATTWLGLTMACAQCHDHKYDPITQRDYYQLLDAFNQVPESGRPDRFSARIRVAPPVLELPTEENLTHIASLEEQIQAAELEAKPALDLAFVAWKKGAEADGSAADADALTDSLREKLSTPVSQRSAEASAAIDEELRKHFDDKVRSGLANQIPAVARTDVLRMQLAEYRADQIPRVMIMSDDRKRDSHILERGEYLKPSEKVSFNTPSFLPPLPESAPPNRLGFAEWLVSSDQPLTARVQVNRMWQHFFGQGIVKTAEDFGVQSEYPLHKDLLDWLAVELRESGWSMKHVNRLIVTSATYRQSSRMSDDLREIDPENRLYARASRFRMPSFVLRDWVLASAGLLDRRVGGVPVYPYQPDDVWEALAITKERDFTYPKSSGADLYRRSLYTFWRRTVSPSNMFDASNRQTCQVRMAQTSTPLHALTTLNDPTWVEAARVLASNCMHAIPELDDCLQAACLRVLCRRVTDKELEVLRRMYGKQLAIYSEQPAEALALLSVGKAICDESLEPSQLAAMTAVCLGIFNFDEALSRE